MMREIERCRVRTSIRVKFSNVRYSTSGGANWPLASKLTHASLTSPYCIHIFLSFKLITVFCVGDARSNTWKRYFFASRHAFGSTERRVVGEPAAPGPSLASQRHHAFGTGASGDEGIGMFYSYICQAGPGEYSPDMSPAPLRSQRKPRQHGTRN